MSKGLTVTTVFSHGILNSKNDNPHLKLCRPIYFFHE